MGSVAIRRGIRQAVKGLLKIFRRFSWQVMANSAGYPRQAVGPCVAVYCSEFLQAARNIVTYADLVLFTVPRMLSLSLSFDIRAFLRLSSFCNTLFAGTNARSLPNACRLDRWSCDAWFRYPKMCRRWRPSKPAASCETNSKRLVNWEQAHLMGRLSGLSTIYSSSP